MAFSSPLSSLFSKPKEHPRYIIIPCSPLYSKPKPTATFPFPVPQNPPTSQLPQKSSQNLRTPKPSVTTNPNAAVCAPSWHPRSHPMPSPRHPHRPQMRPPPGPRPQPPWPRRHLRLIRTLLHRSVCFASPSASGQFHAPASVPSDAFTTHTSGQIRLPPSATRCRLGPAFPESIATMSLEGFSPKPTSNGLLSLSDPSTSDPLSSLASIYSGMDFLEAPIPCHQCPHRPFRPAGSRPPTTASRCLCSCHKLGHPNISPKKIYCLQGMKTSLFPSHGSQSRSLLHGYQSTVQP